MGEDAETKKIANLTFDVSKAEAELTKLETHLGTISSKSEEFAKNISKNLSNIKIDSSQIVDTQVVQKDLKTITGYTTEFGEKMKYTLTGVDFSKMIDVKDMQNNLKKYSELSERTQKSISANLHKEVNKRYTAHFNAQEKIRQSDKETANRQIVVNAKKNAKMEEQNNEHYHKIELENLKHANKMEEINSRQASSVKTLYDKIANYANTYLIYQGFNVLKKGIVDVINEMVELENSMVQIDRVLNESSLNIDDYRDKLMQLAYDYGNSMNNVADITLRLAQAGFNSNEALKLTEKTLLALNTAELNATQATDDMVAVMAQWGYMTGDANEKAQKYGSIIDKINKVADNFPTTSADLMDALKKTSSAFNLAGASIDETIALITAAEEASQRGGKVIGTALSNIVQQLKDEKRLNIAESLGLNFFTDEKKTQFKGIIDIFAEMSQKMQELKNAGKENTTEMQQLLSIFTVFRRNIGASLLGQMSGEDNTYLDALNKSLTATGYSLQENSKYMATAKAAQEQFNTSVLQLKTQVWDSGVEDVYKSMLIFGRQLLNNIGELIGKFGGLPVIVGTATLAFSLLSKQMKIVSYDTKTGIVNTSGFLKKITKLTSNLINYGASLDAAALKTLALKAATIGLNLAATAAATAGMMLLTSIIQELINKEAAAIELQERSIQSTEKQISTRENELTNLEELMTAYDKLAVKTERTPEETTQIYEIQAKIKNILGEQADTIDLINGKYEEQKQKIKDLSLEEKRRLLDEKEKLMIQKQNEQVKVDLPSLVQTQFGRNYENTLMEYGGIDLGDSWDFIANKGGLKGLLDNSTLEEAIDLFTQWEKNLRGIYTQSEDLQNTYNWVNETLNTLTATTKEADAATKDYNKTLTDVVFSDMLNKGSRDPSSIQSQFGNININRQGITWDDKNIEKYRGQLQELNIDLENLKGSYSNILGESNAFNTEMGEVEIAYSPMLQTDKGLVPLYKDEVNEYIQEVLNKAQDAVKNGEYSNLKDAVLGIDAKGIDEFVDTQGNKIKGLIADVGDSAKQTGKQMHENWELISKSFGETIDNGEEFAKLLNYIKNLDLDDLKEIGINVDSVKLGELKANLIELAQERFADFKQSIEETNITLKTTEEITGDLSTKLSDLQSKYTILTTAQKELSESGEITVSTFKNLVDNNLLSYLDVVNGKVNVNTGSMQALAEQTKISAIESLQAAASEDIHRLALGQEASMSTTAKNAIANFGASASNAGVKAQTAASKILELARALATAAAANKELAGENNVSDFEAKAQSISNAYQNIARRIGTIRLSSVGSSGGGSGRSSGRSSGGGSSRSSKTSEAQKKREEDYKKRLKKYTETLEKMEDKEEAWVKKQRELGQLSNSDMLYVTQQRIKKYNQYLNKIKKATWMNTEDRKKLQKEYTDKLKDLQLDYFDYLKGKLEDQTKAIEDARDKRIKALEEEYDKRIDLLKKQKQKEDDINKRQELVNDVEYWKQRTGREAVENLAKAQKELEEYDRDARIDAQIKALEEEEKLKKESIERQAQNEINVLQKTYNAKVKAFSESNKIIYDNSVIESKKLFNTYKKNFVDPLKKELKNINKKSVTYTVKKGDTLASIAKKYNTSVKKIKAANSSVKNGKVKKGQKLKIPMYHQGGIVGGDEETLALLKKGEVVLNTSWSASLNRMMKYFDNATQRNINPINNNSKIEVSGNLVNIQANVRNQSDIDAIGQKVEKILRDKFNIKK